MIHLYYRQYCTSSPKAIQWFKEHRLDIDTQSSGKISREELITILASTDNGLSEIVRNPNHVKEEEALKIQLLEKMTLGQAIDYLKINPKLLRSPIIIEGNKVLVGYNSDQIRIFLPKTYRRQSVLNLQEKSI